MNDYADKASQGEELGTWEEFECQLKSGYRQLAPEKTAQQSLDELCAKKHPSISVFAEQFRTHATRSGFSNVELIRRIEEQRSTNIQLVMVTISQTTPAAIPTEWEQYLDYVLGIEMHLRNDGLKWNTTSTPRAPARDPNAMDIDAVKKAEKLSKEQEEWLTKGLCFRCGKHKFSKGDRCRSPKYRGFYELPKISTTQAHVVEETTELSERNQAIRAIIKKYDEEHVKEPAVENTARIEEVHEESDFVSRFL
ncbi:hypothetical protein OE88DRAFT_1620303 [Heliocybe sulcata]|uniref:Retrotransposon gag domain-containing protein n=1 Tax=Heliocybe sulcata TaxID=5364 RepID=A0A5C3NIP8_9AGAM|nr:hypothetical protein OE88DRAFT_1620303 [Heliocybe sulcata]